MLGMLRSGHGLTRERQLKAMKDHCPVPERRRRAGLEEPTPVDDIQI
jgi:hypothetical protein